MTSRLHGSLPALVTPFTDKGAIHEDDVEVLVRRALDDGATGVVVAGTTGEGALLDPDERRRLTAIAAGVTAPRPDAVLVAGASGPTIAAVVDDVAGLHAAGADAVLALPPAVYPLSPDELADAYLAVADAAPAPVLAYHIPQVTGSTLTPDTWRRVAAHPRILGMKDSSPDATRRREFVAATADLPDTVVLTGHLPTLLGALRAGAHGSITGLATLRQRDVTALHTAHDRGDDAAAARLQDGLCRLSDALGAVGVQLPAVLKAALQLDGVVAERWCRAPVRSVPGARLDHVRTALLR